jgi:hypothetical protein
VKNRTGRPREREYGVLCASRGALIREPFAGFCKKIPDMLYPSSDRVTSIVQIDRGSNEDKRSEGH